MKRKREKFNTLHNRIHIEIKRDEILYEYDIRDELEAITEEEDILSEVNDSFKSLNSQNSFGSKHFKSSNLEIVEDGGGTAKLIPGGGRRRYYFFFLLNNFYFEIKI